MLKLWYLQALCEGGNDCVFPEAELFATLSINVIFLNTFMPTMCCLKLCRHKMAISFAASNSSLEIFSGSMSITNTMKVICGITS